VALARACPYLPTSQALEALGVELMEKAAMLDEDNSLAPPNSENSAPRSRRG
jgi:hypothetical protein